MAKAKTKKQKTSRFQVRVNITATVELDDDLLPDDEWRSMFYDIKTLGEVAEHFAFNYFVNGVEKINRLDGFADRSPDAAKVIEHDVFVESD